MSSYDGYAKEYYHKNKDKILKKTRVYRRRYNRKWYQANREAILANLAAKRLKTKTDNLLTLQGHLPSSVNNP